MTWNRARPYTLAGTALLALVVCGAAWWKLIAANARPSPMRWLDVRDADGTNIVRLSCFGRSVLDGSRLWRWCEGPRGSGSRAFSIDLERRVGRAHPSAEDSIGQQGIAPGPNGDLYVCGMLPREHCTHLHVSGGAVSLPPLPAAVLSIRGLVWLADGLHAVVRDAKTQAAIVYRLHDKTWTNVARVDHGLEPAQHVRFEVGYHDHGRWQFLFSRAPARVAQGTPVPIELFVAGIDTPANPVATLSWRKRGEFRRDFGLPIEGLIGNVFTLWPGGHAALIAYDAGTWKLHEADDLRAGRSLHVEGNRLRRFPLTGQQYVRLAGKELRVASDHGAYVVAKASTEHGPRFTRDYLAEPLLLPRPDGGYWVVGQERVAAIDASYARTDDLGLGERLDVLRSKFERWANSDDYYLSGAAGKLASPYVLLLLLPLLWLIASPAYLLLRRRYRHALDACVLSTSTLYLVAATIYWGRFASMMSRL